MSEDLVQADSGSRRSSEKSGRQPWWAFFTAMSAALLCSASLLVLLGWRPSPLIMVAVFLCLAAHQAAGAARFWSGDRTDEKSANDSA